MLKLAANVEYSGNCGEMINFYNNTFGNSIAVRRIATYRDMPMADILGITGDFANMVWRSEIEISNGDCIVGIELADSMLVAMQKQPAGMLKLNYTPMLMLIHEDKQYLDVLKSRLCDDRGINWVMQEGSRSISYCLEFDGFCADVVSFYESVFDVKSEILRYNNSAKIFNAIFRFDGFVLQLSDSPQSAEKDENGYDPNALLFYKGHGNLGANPLLTMQFDSAQELICAFDKLSVGAKLNKAIGEDNEGSLIDKFGICWHFTIRRDK